MSQARYSHSGRPLNWLVWYWPWAAYRLYHSLWRLDERLSHRVRWLCQMTAFLEWDLYGHEDEDPARVLRFEDNELEEGLPDLDELEHGRPIEDEDEEEPDWTGANLPW